MCKGLHPAHVEERDELQVVRGRVLQRATVARQLRGAVGLVCEFETLTEDLIGNQILLDRRMTRLGLDRTDDDGAG